MKFFKYQSLGNDCILFDNWEGSHAYDISSGQAAQLCDRHYGIGADVLLVIEANQNSSAPSIRIFNADGSRAENCLNGIRCIADYLYLMRGFPPSFLLYVGLREVFCKIVHDDQGKRLVRTDVGSIVYEQVTQLQTEAGHYTAHIAHLGNPHCVIFEKVAPEWLSRHGYEIESHPNFPRRTNVEFVTALGSRGYDMLVYERGCGCTLACGSGAATVAGVLVHLGAEKACEPITIHMPGGSLTAIVDDDGKISIEAAAHCVFKGETI